MLSLQSLDMSYNNLINVSRSCYKDLPNLKILELSNNRYRMDLKTFDLNMLIIHEICLSFQLQSMKHHVLINISRSSRAFFGPCTKIPLQLFPHFRLCCDQVDIIRQLPSLTRLYLANNKLSGTFPSLSSFESRALVELNISKNTDLVNLVVGDDMKWVLI